MGDYTLLAQNIKKLRTEYFLTQKELAEKIHKKEITIRKYESGNIKIPFDSLLDICRVFGIEPSYLFESDDFVLSNELTKLYPEFENDPDRFILKPINYDFINNIKEGNGDKDSLISSVILYFANKHNIKIDLGDFNMYEELLLQDLIESSVVTFLKHKEFCEKHKEYVKRNNKK